MEELNEFYEKFNNIDLEFLKRKDLQQAGFGFGQIFTYLEEMHRIFTGLNVWYKQFPEQQVSQIKARVIEFNNIAHEIKNFNPATIENAKNIFENMKKRTEELYASVIREISPLYQYFLLKEDRGIASAQKTLKKTKQMQEKILANLGKARSKTGVQEHLIGFADDINKRYDPAAKRWRNIIIGLSIGLGAFILAILCLTILGKMNIGQDNKYQILTATVSFISLLSYLLGQSIKNYNTNKHLSVLNRHRLNILRNYDRFRDDSGEDDVLKRALLLQTTSTIYDFNKSGHLKRENKAPGGISFINQIKENLFNKVLQ